ncbi:MULTISPECIES: TnsD family Tn7-like transposition protein [unclassified Nostoc]|uniref:TnsD family Tn7-like transposition protein n=1 Tax=unclassified Nostoc TaxID=2593658 RepID=UPI000B951E83|nr:TnsD family Tn7-like transposition protein [Nostoc sp. 'Peltigera membranacea cyanobiont' 232]OYE03545.1 hypothetical protein CDG79_17750 [Nostoc sp. 'Peltigera membranacea cyanobiont' 232]
MLNGFPRIYPDELLYSVIARYHIRNAYKSFHQSDMELFGYASQQIYRVVLPCNLNHLVREIHLHLFYELNINDLIYHHTLYPFYASFLPPQEAWLLKNYMEQKANVSLSEILKCPRNNKEEAKTFLKFCLYCIEEDTQKYGEPYWHRFHQVPGVIVCPIHRIALNNSLVSIETKEIHYHAPSDDNCPLNTSTTIYNDATLQKLLVFANNIEWLINNNFTFKGLSWLRSHYKTYLTNKNFITVFSKDKFIFHEQEFYNAVLTYYGQEFLEAINPKIIKNPEKYFSNCLLACDVNPVIDRIIHILIIKFLANSIEDFFKA